MRARDNPFRVERLHALAFRFAAADDLEALRARLAHHGGRGALVGPHGSGKSTLLGELAQHLAAEGLTVRSARIGAGQHALPGPLCAQLVDALSPTDAVLLDGAGHLWPWRWHAFRRAVRSAGVVVVTTHRPGRFPTLLRTSTSAALLATLAQELGHPLDRADASALFARHRGNLRDALRALYDRCADA